VGYLGKGPIVPFHVLFSGSSPLCPASEPFLDHVQGVSPSGPRLGLDQDVLAEACLDQATQAHLVVMQSRAAPLERTHQQGQLPAFDQGNEDRLRGPVE
jgi:hypothetical protein